MGETRECPQASDGGDWGVPTGIRWGRLGSAHRHQMGETRECPQASDRGRLGSAHRHQTGGE